MAAFALENELKTFECALQSGKFLFRFPLDPFLDELKANDITVDENLIVAYGAADADYKTLLEPLVSAV